MLIGAGCDYAQGNLFSAAVDGEAASGFFSGFRHIVNPATPQNKELVSTSA
jgi:EAL domain-containing protein (putative c-di-GMP-specific phosphodiesterase class I)